MKFTFECPRCKQKMELSYKDMAQNLESLKCCICGDTPAPDIMTAYQNLGKTITELYGCCECSQGESSKWLPKDVKLS